MLRTGAIIAILTTPLILFMVVAWSVPLGDFAPVDPRPRLPDRPTRAFQAEVQREPHTCGWHALSTIYRAYGVSSAERRLRARLGVDNRAFLYDDSTTGTLHPDIYRVADQDGFGCVTLDLDDNASHDQLDDHVSDGHAALALVVRQETGVMHWVVITKADQHQLTIVDSLAETPYVEPRAELWSSRLLSVLLLRPRPAGPDTPIWRRHLAGVWDMWRAFQRSP